MLLLREVIAFCRALVVRARTPPLQPSGRQLYFKENAANFVYFDPFGDKWLWYKKNWRGVMVPNSGAGRVESFSCKR